VNGFFSLVFGFVHIMQRHINIHHISEFFSRTPLSIKQLIPMTPLSIKQFMYIFKI